MKKVLMIASESSHFRNFHLPYIDRLTEQGTEVFTAANGDFEHGSVTHTKLSFRKKITAPANIGVIFKLARLIRRERFDAVYTNSTLAGIAGRFAAKLSLRRGVKCRHICHGYLFNDDGGKRAKLYLFFEKLVRRRTELLAVMNADDLRIAEKYSLGREIVFINGMGLSAERFPELPEGEIKAERERLLGGEEGVLFLCVGEFSARKNQSLAIEACARLRRGDWRLIFAGEGELLSECESLVKSLGLSEKIKFLGHCSNVNLLYRACDVLISASSFEGLPFNVMEALFCGESIAVSDVKGNRDLAQSGELYPYNSAESLAELLEAAAPADRTRSLPEKYLLANCFEENYGRLRYGD